jgi:hypothetical protein
MRTIKTFWSDQPDEPTDNITSTSQSVAAIGGPSAVTTDTDMTQSDAPKSLKEKIKNATTEKLHEQANKIFPVLEQVDALKDHDGIKTISGILETNTSWDTFRFVAPEGASVNDDAAASINKSIETFYAKVSQEYDRSTANFVTRLASDALQNAALIGDGAYLTQHAANTKIDLAKTVDGSGVTLSVDLGPEFFMVRTYSNDKTTVNNDRLRIPTIAQGTGVNKKIFHDALKVYEARGVEKITLVANVDVGGYAWFRYGFVPRDLKQVEKIYNWIVRIIGKIDIAFKYDDATICKHLFGDELSNTDQPYRINLVKSTLNSIANQFKAKYYNEKEWKKMNETIISDGTNVKINNDMTTKVTFGQVLKLQTLDGGQVFTMLPGEYLVWDGVLDMTDHDRMKTAYAYLNLTDKKKSGKK